MATITFQRIAAQSHGIYQEAAVDGHGQRQCMPGGVQRLLIGFACRSRCCAPHSKQDLGIAIAYWGANLSRKIHGNLKPGRGRHRMHKQIFGQFRIVFEAIFKEIGTSRAIAIETDQVPDQILPCRGIGLLLRN